MRRALIAARSVFIRVHVDAEADTVAVSSTCSLARYSREAKVSIIVERCRSMEEKCVAPPLLVEVVMSVLRTTEGGNHVRQPSSTAVVHLYSNYAVLSIG